MLDTKPKLSESDTNSVAMDAKSAPAAANATSEGDVDASLAHRFPAKHLSHGNEGREQDLSR